MLRRGSPRSGHRPGLLAIATIASAVLASPSIDAQPRPAAPPPPPAAHPAPVPPAGAAADAGAATAVPPSIGLDDPMLTPVPQANKVLTNWKQALDFILARSVDVATAEQEVKKAEGIERQALALALPTITGTLSVTGQLITSSPAGTPPQLLNGTVNGTNQGVSVIVPGQSSASSLLATPNPLVNAALTVSQPILAPRAWYGIRTADMQKESAKLAYDDKKRTIFVGVANSIITVFTAERTAEINRSGLRTALETYNLTLRQFKLGAATHLDVIRTQQNAEAARATLVSGDESLRQAREALGLALGFREAYGVPSDISLDEIDKTVKDICSPTPLEERADIKKAKNDIEVAKRGITDAWLQFSPTATISSTANIENTTQFTSGHEGAWNIMGVLTVPFWDGGARYGTLKIARANHEEAKLALEAAIRGADIQTQQALRSVAVAERERAVSAKARDLAKEVAQLTLRQFQVGTGTSFDLVTAAQNERAAELDLVVKEFALVQAKLAAVLSLSNCAY